MIINLATVLKAYVVGIQNFTGDSGIHQFLYYSDGTTVFRKGVIAGELVVEIQNESNPFEIAGTMLQYRYYSDGTTTFRDGVRNGTFVIDKALTELGFDGVENVDWECVVW